MGKLPRLMGAGLLNLRLSRRRTRTGCGGGAFRHCRSRMKKPTREERERSCTGKRKYRSQGDALDAALLVGVERQRKAYLCPLCRAWHLTSR